MTVRARVRRSANSSSYADHGDSEHRTANSCNNPPPILLKRVMNSHRQNTRPHRVAEPEYLEIELDAASMKQVEGLAAEASLTPFNMCVTLLREEIAARRGSASRE